MKFRVRLISLNKTGFRVIQYTKDVEAPIDLIAISDASKEFWESYPDAQNVSVQVKEITE